jgi:hypothetical protein
MFLRRTKMSDNEYPDVGARFMEPIPGGFRIDEVKLTRIKLEPGEVLAVRIYSDSVDSMNLAMLKRQLTSLFPDNRIMLFALPSGDRMEIEVMAPTESEEASSCALPTSYCDDCHCGKKERVESERKE